MLCRVFVVFFYVVFAALLKLPGDNRHALGLSGFSLICESRHFFPPPPQNNLSSQDRSQLPYEFYLVPRLCFCSTW